MRCFSAPGLRVIVDPEICNEVRELGRNITVCVASALSECGVPCGCRAGPRHLPRGGRAACGHRRGDHVWLGLRGRHGHERDGAERREGCRRADRHANGTRLVSRKCSRAVRSTYSQNAGRVGREELINRRGRKTLLLQQRHNVLQGERVRACRALACARAAAKT